ncbi:hypothetical protein, partial [Pantoea sp. VS1]|uniref:hypothetical protein n=1 Tax=Pantoea sp. VS1 TaxID=2003658 RepID=UPI001C3E7002
PCFGRFWRGGFDVDVVCVHGISPAQVGCHVSVDPVAAKGKRATAGGGCKGAAGVHFTLAADE